MDDIILYVNAIREYMATHKKQEKDVAEELGVSPGSISNWFKHGNGISPKNRDKIRLLNPKFFEFLPEQPPKINKKRFKVNKEEFEHALAERDEKIKNLYEKIDGLNKSIEVLKKQVSEFLSYKSSHNLVTK